MDALDWSARRASMSTKTLIVIGAAAVGAAIGWYQATCST